ncbi:MAG: hypothetical protein E3J87_09590 [Candidatus Cloacimonadota bacterium]|nr:MAG: hypothetical protein E3J87_09590 [Candidatus Cloacimonadota bacterium]
MKRFKIDLSEYSVAIQINKRNEETKKIELVTEEIPYPLKDNIYQWLRLPGIFKGGVEICDACDLAKQIRDAGDDIVLDEHEIGLLKTAMDKLISQESNPAQGVIALGGEIHETCIRRVFKAEEVK